MKRLSYALVAIGVVAALYGMSTYRDARQQYNAREALCALTGSCTATLDWQRAAMFSVVAVVAFLGALAISKRAKGDDVRTSGVQADRSSAASA